MPHATWYYLGDNEGLLAITFRSLDEGWRIRVDPDRENDLHAASLEDAKAAAESYWRTRGKTGTWRERAIDAT